MWDCNSDGDSVSCLVCLSMFIVLHCVFLGVDLAALFSVTAECICMWWTTAGQEIIFGSVDPRFLLLDEDFNEGIGRGERLSTSNSASSRLPDQPLAVTEHS